MQELLSREDILSQIALADMKLKQQLNDEVIEIYKFIVERTKDAGILSNVYNRLGNIYYNNKDFDNAIWAYENTLKYCKANETLYNMLGYLYFYKDIDKSIAYYLKGMEIKPDIKNFEMLTQVMIKSVNYSQKDLKNFFEKYVDYFRPTILDGVVPYHYDKKSFDKNKKLKIGYLSSEFYCHAMMSFVIPIIENHNLNEMDITLYNCAEKTDIVTERLKQKGVAYKDCSKMTNIELAKTIHDDNVDILVDLSGYTHPNRRIWTLLYKPAPIIVQFLGFLGTYGIKEVDYIFVDKFTVPPSIAKYYTEKPMYIDCGMNRFTFQVKNRSLPQITPLPYEENGYITFGSFNAMSKINTYTLDLWSNALKAVPDSKLLIYRTQLEEKDIVRFKKVFDANGIEPDRIIFDNKPTPESHMNSYLKCDFALDPVPFSGLTITIEQAFMGVPTLTLPKETIASKGTARVNNVIGLKEFIAKDEKDFVKKAIKISHNIDKLRYYRKNLPTIIENSQLCSDFENYGKTIEKAYKKVWKEFCK